MPSAMTDSDQNPWYADGLRFTCTQCGNCCTGPPGYVWFDAAELDAMAAHFNLTAAEFRRRYAHKIDGRWSLNEVKTVHGYDCVFLDRTPEGKALCTIYAVRPMQCRTWPFWPENLKSQRAWLRASNTCPGVATGMKGQGQHYTLQQIRIRRDQTPTS